METLTGFDIGCVKKKVCGVFVWFSSFTERKRDIRVNGEGRRESSVKL